MNLRSLLPILLALCLASGPALAGETHTWDHSSTHSTTHVKREGNTIKKTTNSETHGSSFSVTTPDANTAAAALGGALMGSLLSQKPENARRVNVSGEDYHVADGNYYKEVPGGYQAVDTPDGAKIPVHYNVPQSGGGTRVVTLNPAGSGYVGPDGEYYATVPQESEIERRYAR